MRDALIALALVGAVGFMSYKTGYNRAQSYYVARIEQTERALKEVLQRSSFALRELSQEVGLGDDRDFAVLQEIINASNAAGDICRVALDRLRPLDAISP
jgi:hypothetical protein